MKLQPVCRPYLIGPHQQCQVQMCENN